MFTLKRGEKLKLCEFKVIRKNDNSQIAEDILILSYNDNNELLLKDILGMGEKLESALILDVNTMNQTCVVLEHPLIKSFVELMKKINDNHATKKDVEALQDKLEELKISL